MGSNEWRTGDAWPLPETQWTKILLLTLAPSPTVDDIYWRLSSVSAELIKQGNRRQLSIRQGSLPPCNFMESAFVDPKAVAQSRPSMTTISLLGQMH